MNKNTMLAIALSAVVILAFQVFFAPKSTVLDQQTQAIAETKVDKPVAEEKATPQAEEIQIEQTAPAVLETFDVNTKLVNYSFNENTGNISSATINEYAGRELEDIKFASPTSDVVFADIPFISVYKSNVRKNNGKTTVTFTGSQGDVVVTKKYEIKDGNYLVNGSVTISNTGERTVSVPFNSGIGSHAVDAFESDRYTFQGPLMFDGKRLKKKKAEKVDESIVVDKPAWVGYMSKYYMVGVAQDFETGIIAKKGDSATVTGKRELKLNPGASEEISFNIFAGPKEYKLLKSYGKKFEKSIDFGIFYFLAIPMLAFLKIIYGYVGNYGVAIILLTLAIKLVTFPLTQKSMVSMKKMSSLQPKMAALKEKYKGDKELLNKANMELYKKEGVNPLGGCLPMILQIPVFFALYKTLLLSIELQGAPFIFWITDLALKDPYYVTPLLMGATMFLQQRMTPSTATDPLQKKIFMYMPLVFTFLFLTFPAGLVVYWLTNNVLTIAQQYVINKKLA
ncbi:MAG: preprotein translocase YidC [Denitrovibrio sp.]|nr:MAG: preprotein translocase YidC [Denitrovibrio sp.]